MNCRYTFLRLGTLLLALSICPSARADLRFEKPFVDLGKIRGGPQLTYAFHFINAGQQPIQIVETRASCTCMQPVVGPQYLRPGEKGTLQIVVNTLSLTPGPHTWAVRIAYRDPTAAGEASLNIGANYTPEVSVTPSSVTFYTDNALTHEITLTDIRDKTLKIVGVESSSQYLQAIVTRQQRNFRGHLIGTITLQTRRDMPPGRHDETVSIFTDDAHYRQLQVNVTVVKKAAADQVTVHPGRVTLYASKSQPVASQLLRVHSTGSQPVNIRNISADIPGFGSRWGAGPGVDATVRVLADGSQVRSETQGTIRIEIDRPTRETLAVPVTVIMEQ